MTRESLLAEILQHEPYKGWVKTGRGRLGLGEWREPSKKGAGVSGQKLDALGIYDFVTASQVSSLWAVAKEVGISVPVSVRSERKAKAIDETRAKTTGKIVARLNNKTQYKADFLSVLWPYFATQRGIPFPSKKEAYLWCHQQKITVQRFTKEGISHCEIVIPLSGPDGELVQTVKIAVDESNGCRKIGKKICGSADRDRACIWGNENANEIILFEGIEDAMSFWFAMGEVALAGSNVGFVAGHAGYNSVTSITNDYSSRVVICDNDSSRIGLRATESLGPEWLRVIPATEIDCNAALHDNGPAGVLRWFEQLERISWEQFREICDELDSADLEQAKTATFLYHYNRNPWTDAGTVQAFVVMWGSQVRVSEDGSWWTWKEGKLWCQDIHSGDVGRKIAALSPVYERLAKMYLKQHKDKEEKCVPAIQCEAWAEKLASSHTQRGVISMLRGAGELQCRVEDFDARPELLNLQNGILNFSTGKLEPHAPAAMCSRICNVAWNPSADCPTWDRFMSEITCEDLELGAYKARQHGYLASGYTREKAFFFHLGPTSNNGKSTEADLLQWLMGTYAETVKCDLFLEDRFAGNGASDYELAKLPGVRLAIAGETEDKRAWSEAAIKRFTGGKDRISARHIRQSPFTFQPRFKAIIHGNNKPKLTVADPAFMNRIHLVPYNFVIEVMDGEIDEKLKREGSGILNRIYWGFYDWWNYPGGLAAPKCMEDAKKEYQAEAFADVEEFINENCDLGEGLEEQASKLWRAYQGWLAARRSKGDCKTQTSFGRQLGRLGYEDVQRRVEGDWKKRLVYRTKIKLRAVEDRTDNSGRFDGEFD